MKSDSGKPNMGNEVCYFCGAPATSEDHLPPSGIFPDPKPTDRISVPSCDQHNSQQSKEDEYFRWFVATASSENPTAKALIKGKITREFKERPKLLRVIMRHSGCVEVRTPSGLYIGKQPAFKFKRDRIQSVITRMTKGLFFHFYHERLPDSYFVKDFLLNPHLDDVEKFLVAQIPLHDIGNGVFSFRFQRDADDPYFTSWLYMFYDCTLIATLTERRPLGNGN